MPLVSSDYCPACRTPIALSKSSSGVFRCPACSCEFRHNRKKWFFGIPLGLGVALGLLYFTYEILPPIFLAFLAVGIVALVISRIPAYLVITPGAQKKEPIQPPVPTRGNGT